MLLEDIINLAVDNKQPITTLLRKCIVLAHQLNNEQLKMWANGELNGYSSLDNVPEYRTLPAAASGTFVGPGWARCQQGIPSFVLKEQHQKWAESVYIAQAIGTLEHMLSSGDGSSSIFFPWNDNLIALYRDELV